MARKCAQQIAARLRCGAATAARAMTDARPILVFDSGVGGLSVLGEIRALLPNAPIVYAADSAGFPYGTKSAAEIAARVPALLGRLAERYDPALIVIACNTASTIALDAVRAALDLPIVGTVPGDQAGRRAVQDPRDRRARHRRDHRPALCRPARRRVRRRLPGAPPRLGRAGRARRGQAARRGDRSGGLSRASSTACSPSPAASGSTRSSSPAPISRWSRRSSPPRRRGRSPSSTARRASPAAPPG